MTQKEIALQQALKLKSIVYDVARELGSKEGFYNYWFNAISKCDTHKEAYNVVEALHEKIFNYTRFSSYQSFKTQKSKYFKNRKNVSNQNR